MLLTGFAAGVYTGFAGEGLAGTYGGLAGTYKGLAGTYKGLAGVYIPSGVPDPSGTIGVLDPLLLDTIV